MDVSSLPPSAPAPAPACSVAIARSLTHAPKLPFKGVNTSLGSRAPRISPLALASKKKSSDKVSFGDQLLDYIEGGPKLRKWYGAPDQIRKDGADESDKEKDDEELQIEDEEARDAVLVVDADSMTGQLLVLALIVKRVRIRALVKDEKEIVQAFGSYVEPVIGNVEESKSLKLALKGVRAVICPTKIGALANKEITRGLEHIVFLSQSAAYSNSGGLAAFLYSNAIQRAKEDERNLVNLGIPCTIVRSAPLRDEQGGQKGFLFKEGSAKTGVISREDAAMICVRALEYPPKKSVAFEVANGDDIVEDWKVLFESLNCIADYDQV